MSNQIVAALERAAKQIVHSLGEAAAKAEQRLLHETADGLEHTARSHRTFDEHAASDLERAAAQHPDVHAPHGASDPVLPTAAAGPSLSSPPELHGAEPLADPTTKLSAADHPYLQPSSLDREVEALPGAPHPGTGKPVDAPPGHVELPREEWRTFDGPIQPYVLQPGTTYYRAVGDTQYPNGSYWTQHPVTETELRSDFAVLNKWNGDHGVVAFTPNHPVQGWIGTVAPMPATGDLGSHLAGGGTQIWLQPKVLGPEDGTWQIAPAVERSDP